jgi:hypothetical protein
LRNGASGVALRIFALKFSRVTFQRRKRGNHMRRSIILAGVLILPSFTPAYCYTKQQASACISDALRFCASEIPDVQRVTKCLRSKRSALSSGCALVFTRQQDTDFREERAQDRSGQR